MIRSVHLCRFVASIAIFMVVWCQTSAAAQGCLIDLSTPATEAAAASPCHEAATDSSSDTSQRDCKARCQARDASFESAKIHLPAIDDLLIGTVSTAWPASIATCVAPNDQTAERAAPPPLILVYCRLLM